MLECQQTLKYLDYIAEKIPCSVYWLDLNYKILGVNTYGLKYAGAPSKEYVIGKTAYDFHPTHIADSLQQDFEDVVVGKQELQRENVIEDITTGKLRYYTTTISPLCDDSGNIIGVIGTSIETTNAKAAFEQEYRALRKDQIFKHIEYMADKMPANLYWADLNLRILGVNQNTLNAMGALSKDSVIGKTIYEIYPKDIADYLALHAQRVISSRAEITKENVIKDMSSGRLRYYSDTMSPILDNTDNIIGIIGTSIETTAHKEAEQLIRENERLEFENRMHQIREEEQSKFGRAIRQWAHDMVSPTSTLEGVAKRLGSSIPEDERVNIRNSVERIAGISQRLISRYDSNADSNGVLLVPLALVQIMNERREQHRKSGVIFNLEIDEGANFEFIKLDIHVFVRMISNLINNAVDALKGRADAKVEVGVMSNAGQVLIVVEDNGPGMPKHIQEKIAAGIEVTEGKANGHGIGLTQVVDAINAGGGTYKIHASEKYGTQIYIWFPRIDTPNWLATEVKLTKDNTVIVLDDDTSIHGAWDSNFKSILAKHPSLKIEHFTHGSAVIEYINSLTPEQKENVFLLTDYELLDQGMNGLDVVMQTGMSRAILVTSYAAHTDVQYKVAEAGIKLLPKELAYAVSIVVDKKIDKWGKKVDMVWVEDRKQYVDDLVKRYYSHLMVDVYYDPVSFMEDVHQYPLDTRIILDTYYESPDGIPYIMDGFRLAKKLNEMGYTKLILFAGETPKVMVPNYLQVVLKSESVSNHQQLDEV